MDDESKLNNLATNNSSPPNMEIQSPIYRLPIELLTKIIEYVPRTQWPALELVDPDLFLNATLLAWGSIREVDIRRDFIYSESKAIKDDEDHAYKMVKAAVGRDISRKTESILKKLVERSSQITSLSGVSLLSDDSSLNTTSIHYLSRFEHLETVRFASNYFISRTDAYTIEFSGGVHLINLTEFIESTGSRATLKEISIGYCQVPADASEAGHFERFRAAFVNDPSRQSLRMESFSLGTILGYYRPLNSFDTIDASRMTELSFTYSKIESTVLTILINGAPRLRHLDFAFVQSCETECNGERLQSNIQLLVALESHQSLTSLGFKTIWERANYCACVRFETALLKMLNTIGPRLENFLFMPGFPPSGVSMNEICAIVRNRMPRLKSINLFTHVQMDAEGFCGIFDYKELEKVQLHVTQSFSEVNMMNGITSSIVSKSHCLKRYIDSNMRPDQRVVAELCKLNDLVDLRINASTLSKENFIAFSQAFAAQLEVLHLGEINRGAESGLIELIAKCNQLRELEIDRNMSDRLLKCVVESCPNLEKFTSWCADGITSNGVQSLVDGCPKLRWLKVVNNVFAFKDVKIGRYRKICSC